jgi:YVTN family beta-propeller protein
MRHIAVAAMAVAFSYAATTDVRSAPRNVEGEWSPVYNLEMVPSSGALLPDGKVLLWSANRALSFWEGEWQVHTAVFDPNTNTHVYRVQPIPHNMFCTGTTQLADGSLLVNGGTQSEATSIWTQAAGEWTQSFAMNVTRGYNANTLLEDGRVFTLGGSWSGGSGGKIGEIFTPGTGWKSMPGIQTTSMETPSDVYWAFDSHFWLVSAGNGRVFYPGPGVNMQWLDMRGNGSVTPAGSRASDSWSITGAAVMYDQGKILTAGGSYDYDDVWSKKESFIVDINGSSTGHVRTTQVGSMTYGRAFTNGVVLPNGEVVMVGGQAFMKGFEDSDAVFPAEIFNPDSKTWRTMAAASVPRNYHSIGLLLPDGRVLSGGGGLCGDCLTNHPDFQIFSPPYLFDASGNPATRPQILSAPATLEYGETITVTTNGPVSEFSIVRFGATTHTINNDQRRLSLTHRSVGGNTYEIDIPTNPGWLLPGNWMLFAMNSAGTPSVGKITRVKLNATVSIVSPFELYGTVGDPIDYDVTVSKKISNVTFSGKGLPAGVTVDPVTGDLGGVPTQSGFFRASIVGTGPAQTVSTDFLFWVAPGGANRPPVLSGPSSVDVMLNVAADVAFTASDPDGDALDFSATDLPPGLSIDPITGHVSGTPTQPGTFASTVMVTDASGATDIQDVDFTVSFGWMPAVASLEIRPAKVGETVRYEPELVNAWDATLRWNFGDGKKDSGFSDDTVRSHVYKSPGVYTLTIEVRAPDGRIGIFNADQAVYPAGKTARPDDATAGTAFTGKGALLWVANRDNDSVSVLDTGKKRRIAEIRTGDSPEGLAVAPDGNVWVVNRGSATISVINPSSRKVSKTIVLPHGSKPWDVVFRKDGRAVVSLEALRQLAVIDKSGKIVDRVTMAGPVRGLAYDAKHGRVLASRFISPPVPGESTAKVQVTKGAGLVYSMLDSGKRGPAIRIAFDRSSDSERSGRGLPNYLNALAISPDGKTAWVPSKKDNIARGKLRDGLGLDFQTSVRAIISKINLETGKEIPGSRIDIDNTSLARAAVFHPTGAWLFVALETSREVAVIDPFRHRELFRFSVGRSPNALAISANGRTLFVHNFMDRSVSVVDLTPLVTSGQKSATIVGTIGTVGKEKLDDVVFRGKQLFYDAADPRLSRDKYMSCAVCHDDGEGDGRTWDFTGFGEGLRNTASLQGKGGMLHGFLHWSANFDEVQDFEGQIRAFAGGTGLMDNGTFFAGTRSTPLGDRKAGFSPDLDALAAYVSSLTKAPVSPFVAKSGKLSATQAAGRTLFDKKGCDTCHAGTRFTISGGPKQLRNIGTIDKAAGKRLAGPLKGIDVPTLKGIQSTGPYLHDGSAKSIADAIRKHRGVKLSKDEMSRIVDYLKTL